MGQQNDGANVTGADFVGANQIKGGVGQLIGVVGDFHSVNVGGIEQALHVFAQTEYGDALRRVVGANAFEDGGAVTDDVGKDVDLGVVPGDKFSVVPDLFGCGKRHPPLQVRKLQKTLTGSD